MPIRNMMSDHVTLAKLDGRRIENIPANVQPSKIFIDDAKVPIEEGDHIERTLSNGLVERYLVLDRGFYEGLDAIPDHYQVSVRKETAIPRVAGPSSVTYNVSGPNARVNVNSVDASQNAVQSTHAMFQDIREALSRVAEPARSKTLVALTEMENSVGTSSFRDRYIAFISSVADHMTIVSPFLPALTKLLAVG